MKTRLDKLKRYKIKHIRKGGKSMDNKSYKTINLEKLRSKKSIIVSSQEALKDVLPINWSNDVLLGKKKIEVSYNR